MIVVIKETKAISLVAGSTDTVTVSVAYAPQAQPLEFNFLSMSEALQFVEKITSDGAYAKSVVAASNV